MATETITTEGLMRRYYTQEVFADNAVKYDASKNLFLGTYPRKYLGSLLCDRVEFCKAAIHQHYPEIHGKAQDWIASEIPNRYLRMHGSNRPEQDSEDHGLKDLYGILGEDKASSDVTVGNIPPGVDFDAATQVISGTPHRSWGQDEEKKDPDVLTERDSNLSFYFQVHVPDDLVTRIKESIRLSVFDEVVEEVMKGLRERLFPGR